MLNETSCTNHSLSCDSKLHLHQCWQRVGCAVSKDCNRAFLFRLPTWFVNGVDWQLAEFKGKVMLANFLRGQTLNAMSLISNSRHATLHPYRDLGLVCLNGRLPSLVATVRTLILQSGLRPGYPGNSAPTLPRLWQLCACRGADVRATPVM